LISGTPWTNGNSFFVNLLNDINLVDRSRNSFQHTREWWEEDTLDLVTWYYFCKGGRH
jgi:hypothetical protein